MNSIHQRKFWFALAAVFCLFAIQMSARPAQAATLPTVVRSSEQAANPHLMKVQRRHPRRSFYVSRRNDWVAPAIMLGVIGVIAASQQYPYYSAAPYGSYYSQPHVYSPPNGPRRCYVVTDDARNYGYWGWCR